MGIYKYLKLIHCLVESSLIYTKSFHLNFCTFKVRNIQLKGFVQCEDMRMKNKNKITSQIKIDNSCFTI